MTHAFFKGLLFLARRQRDPRDGRRAGHAQDGRPAQRKFPITFWTMFIATLAIAGVPGFAGFFSKDEILEAAQSGPYANLAAVAARTCRGAGSRRSTCSACIFLTFFGKQRFDEHKVHVHESPRNMTIPLMILAFLSIFGGWLAAPQARRRHESFRGVPASGVRCLRASSAAGASEEMLAGSAGERGGINQAPRWNWCMRSRTAGDRRLDRHSVAWWFYIQRPGSAEETRAEHARALHALLQQILRRRNLRRVIVRPLLWISTNVLWHVVDEGVIDGTVNGSARIARESGGQLRELQSGNTRSYASGLWWARSAFTALLLGIWMKVH